MFQIQYHGPEAVVYLLFPINYFQFVLQCILFLLICLDPPSLKLRRGTPLCLSLIISSGCSLLRCPCSDKGLWETVFTSCLIFDFRGAFFCKLTMLSTGFCLFFVAPVFLRLVFYGNVIFSLANIRRCKLGIFFFLKTVAPNISTFFLL